jgi:hypothetical protein
VDTLKELSSCDSGQFRTINGFQLVPATFQNLGVRPFSLEFTVLMTCRGCGTQTTLLEYLDSNGKPQDTCPCGGPSLLKFQVLFQQKFDALLDNRKLSNIEALTLCHGTRHDIELSRILHLYDIGCDCGVLWLSSRFAARRSRFTCQSIQGNLQFDQRIDVKIVRSLLS